MFFYLNLKLTREPDLVGKKTRPVLIGGGGIKNQPGQGILPFRVVRNPKIERPNHTEPNQSVENRTEPNQIIAYMTQNKYYFTI